MTKTKYSETETILAAMMTENTGRHFLDSGGAYGRQWERNLRNNPERSPAPYLAQPKAWFDSGEFVTISTFHYLRDRITYLPRADREFVRWANTPPPGMDRDDYSSETRVHWSWFESVEAFLKIPGLTGVDGHAWSEHYETESGNTYNHDNNLSQDFVWFTRDVRLCMTHKKFHVSTQGNPIKQHKFKDPEPVESFDGYIGDLTLKDLEPGTGPFLDCEWWDVTLIGISLHGGCDARGGYTQVRLFMLEYSDAPIPYGLDEFELWCDPDPEPGDPDYVDPLQPVLAASTPGPDTPSWPERPERRHGLSHRGGEWTSWEGDSMRDPWAGATHNHPLDQGCRWSCTSGITPTITPAIDDRYPAGAPERFRDGPIPMWGDDSDPDALPASERGRWSPSVEHWINCPWCGRKMSVGVPSY